MTIYTCTNRITSQVDIMMVFPTLTLENQHRCQDVDTIPQAKYVATALNTSASRTQRSGNRWDKPSGNPLVQNYTRIG